VLRGPGSLVVLGVTLSVISLNLRMPVTSVGPVLDDIRDALHLSSTAAGVLTTLPVLCFGLVAPSAPRLLRHLAPEVVLLACLGGITAGVLLRIPETVVALFLGSVVIGSAIAVANVLVPAVIKRDFERPGTMMGMFAVSLSLGGAIGAGFSVPLEHLLGSWNWALGAWAVPAAVCFALWLPRARRAHAAADGEPVAHVTLWTDRKAQAVAGLMGCQALLFYAIVAWLPDILKAHGVSESRAGLLLSIGILVGIPSSLAVPVLAERREDQRMLAIASAALWVVGLLGMLLAPDTVPLVWVLLLGLGSGANLSLAFAFFALRSPDGRHAAALSGMAQSIGYLVAAIGPLAVGVLHDVTDSWDAPLVLLLAVSVLMLAFSLSASLPGFVQGREAGAVSSGS
jgi:MFS transporter, CP family, cyanate transporter